MNVCKYCGKNFIYRYRRNEIFCSADCRVKFHHKSPKEKHCAVCGNSMDVQKRKYCSDECSRLANIRNVKKRQLKDLADMKAGKEAIKQRAKPKPPALAIEEVAKLATAASLTYGQYCAKFKL